MRRPLKNLSSAAGFLALLLGAFGWILAALSSIAGYPSAGMGLGRGGGTPEYKPESAPGLIGIGPGRSRHLRIPGLAALLAWSRRRRRLATLLAVLALAALGTAVYAFFTAGASANSAGGSSAATMPTGTGQTAVKQGANSIKVSWSQVSVAGHPITTYVVQRYDSSGSPQVTGVGCNTTVTGLTCTESSVPFGSWKYRITPVIGTNWQGTASPFTSVVTIATGTLTLAPSLIGGPSLRLPQTLTGSLSGFNPSESLTFRLDNPTSGTILTGTPPSTDGSGNASVSVTIPSGTADGAHTVYAVGGFGEQASAGVTVDSTAPTSSASMSPAAIAGWNKADVTVTLTATDATSGVQKITYSESGAQTLANTTYSAPFVINTEGTTTITFFATDNAGNVEPLGLTNSVTVKLDKTPPTNSISLNPVTPNELLSGSTVWYRGVNAGSFTLSNAVTDALSGPASSGYAALSGTSTGWHFTSSSSTTGPSYTSNTFSWDAGTNSSPTETVTGFDVASNFTTAPALTFTNDSTGPANGSVDATVLVGTSSRYSTSTTLSIALNAGNDGTGVGMAASGLKLFRDVATLSSTGTPAGISDGTCGAYSGTPTLLATDPTSPYTDNAAGGISTGHCYQYTYVVSDKLGNQTTYASGDVKVDTSAPSMPSNATLAPVTGTGFLFLSGQNLFYNPTQAGSFTVDSSTSDLQSGIQQMTFPSISGFSGGGNVTTPNSGTTYRATYSWNNNGTGSSVAQQQSIAATNNATGQATNSTAFSLTKDGTAPTTTDNAPSGYTKNSVTVTLTPTDNSGGSGVANTYYTTDGSTPSTGSSSGTSISLTTDGVYPIKYFSVDKVGNTESVKTATNPVQIDKTNPTPAAIGTAGAYVNGPTTYVKNSQALTDAATDPTVNGASSGVASVHYYYCAGTCTPVVGTNEIGAGSTTSPSYSVTWNSQPADGTYSVMARVTDNAGNAANSAVIQVAIDNTVPVTGDSTGTLNNNWKNTNQAVTLSPTDPVTGGVASGVDKTYYAAGSPSVADPTTSSSQGTSVALNGDGLWQVKYFSTDHVGNSESVKTAGTVIRIDETAPNAGAVVTAGAFTSGSTYIKSGQALTDTTTSDPIVNSASSGVATVRYWYCSSGCGGTTPTSNPGLWTSVGSSSTASSYSVTWNSQPGDGTYSLIAGATDNAGNTAYSALKTVVIDNTAPATGFNVSPSPNAGGWNKVNASVTLSPSDGSGSGVASTTYSESGAQILGNTTYSGAITISTEGSTTITFHSVDNLSNTESNKTVTIKLDKTAPNISITSITAGGTTACEFVNGSQAWYSTTGTGNSCGSASGSFAMSVTAADPNATASGVSDVLFPTLTGFSGGGDVLAPGPYSTSYGWTNSTNASPSSNVTAFDNAGNSNTAGFSFTLDNTAPTGPITSPAAGNVSGTTTLASTSAADNVGGSGFKSLAYYRCTGAPATCTSTPPGGAWTLIGSATSSPYNVSWDTTAVPNGSYTLKGLMTDNVGNQASTAGVGVTVNNTYAFVLGSIATQRAGTAFSGFTIQLQVNGSNTGSFGGASYSGARTITFAGTATANSPNSGTASGLSQSLTFNASGQATTGNITLVKAQSGAVLSATDSTNSITGNASSFTVDSAGVTTNFTGTYTNTAGTVTNFTGCPGSTIKRGTAINGTLTFPVDAFGNAFTSAAGISVPLNSTSGNYVFQATNGQTQTLAVSTGPAGNTFQLNESGATKSTTLSATLPSPFTAPSSCSMTSN